MQALALAAQEERRKAEAAEGGRRQREGLAFPTGAAPAAAAASV